MALPKYDWNAVRKDYEAKTYSSTEELAKAYDMPYSYLRKKVAKWNQENTSVSQIKKTIKNIDKSKGKNSNRTDEDILKDLKQFLPTELALESNQELILSDYEAKVPNDRAAWHKKLYDKLGVIVEAALDNPELNFFTQNGQVKTKALSDMASIIQVIQKGQESTQDDKATGQLTAYADMIANLRANKKK